MRIFSALILIVSGVTLGCGSQDSCIRIGTDQDFGTDHFEKITLVTNHVNELGLPTTDEEVASIVGVAYAVSQLEGGQSGVPVEICFRSGKQGDTEYRVLSAQGKLLNDWQSTATISTP